MNLAPLKLNKNLYFLVEEGNIILWDYQNNQQFVIDNDLFQTILKISSGDENISGEIYSMLKDGKILEPSNPEPPPWLWDKLSHIFHIGTKDVLDKSKLNAASPEELAQSYLKNCNELLKTEKSKKDLPNDTKKIKLPEPDLTGLKNISYFDVIDQRKTCRDFNDQPIDIQALSTVLFASFGEFHKNKPAEECVVSIRKTSPSSGGLHAEEAYVCIYRVNGIKPGLYYYDSSSHALLLLKKGNFENEVISMNYQQYFSKHLAFGVYITSRFDLHAWKYKHSRQYRVALVDLGHVSQTFLLAATALKLNTWITAAFEDTPVEAFLGVDGINESAILFLGAGLGNNSAIPNAIRDRI
jgi:SagB-type dehydrogenase family enzyme